MHSERDMRSRHGASTRRIALGLRRVRARRVLSWSRPAEGNVLRIDVGPRQRSGHTLRRGHARSRRGARLCCNDSALRSKLHRVREWHLQREHGFTVVRGMDLVRAGLVRKPGRYVDQRSAVHPLRGWHHIDLAEPKLMLAGGRVSGGYTAARPGDANGRRDVRALRARDVLPRRGSATSALPKWNLGRRRQRRHGLHCLYVVCARAKRLYRGNETCRSNVRRVRERHLWRDRKRSALRVVDNLPAWRVRLDQRQCHGQPSLHCVRERLLFDECKPSLMHGMDYVRRWNLRQRVGLDHDRPHVHGVRERDLGQRQ